MISRPTGYSFVQLGNKSLFRSIRGITISCYRLSEIQGKFIVINIIHMNLKGHRFLLYARDPKVVGSNPTPATKYIMGSRNASFFI